VRAREQMRRLSFAAFAPGRFRRDQYQALARLIQRHEIAVALLAALDELALGAETADFQAAAWRVSRLSRAARDMAAMLERVNPAAALGLGEKLSKIDFYLRLGLDLALPDPSPPHVVPGPDGRSFTVTAGAFEYFMEHAALRPALGKRLRLASLKRPEAIGPLSSEARGLILSASAPGDLAAAIAEAAARIARPGASITALASALPGQAGQSAPGRLEDLAPGDCPDAYQRLIADKYGPEALAARIAAGLADAETPLTVTFTTAKPDPADPDAPAPASLRSRLAKLAPYLSGPGAAPAPGPAAHEPRSRDAVASLAQAVSYAREAAMAEVFALAGGPGRGPAAKRLRTQRPPGSSRTNPAIAMDILDLGGGLFHPDELGEEVDPEQIKSGPLWALWCGLAAQDEDDPRLHSLTDARGRAMITADYVHLTLAGAFGELDIDADFAPAGPNCVFARLCLNGLAAKRRDDLAKAVQALGFATRRRASLIDAAYHGHGETISAKTLARLGRLLAAM
jgi:hypothetical protein